MDRSGSRLKRFFIMGLTALFLFGFFVPIAAAWGKYNSDEFWENQAVDFMTLPDGWERKYWWEKIYDANDRIDLARAIGRLEGEFGPNIWWDLRAAETETETDLTNVDFSSMGPMYEWAKEVYEQNKSELTEAISQIMKGPNPDLPGLWSEKKPYGDIYGSGDRILDDRGDEYIKQNDGSWAATGNNYGPSKPSDQTPGTEIETASQPQSQSQPQPQPQPDPPQQGNVCPYCGQDPCMYYTDPQNAPMDCHMANQDFDKGY